MRLATSENIVTCNIQNIIYGWLMITLSDKLEVATQNPPFYTPDSGYNIAYTASSTLWQSDKQKISFSNIQNKSIFISFPNNSNQTPSTHCSEFTKDNYKILSGSF